MGLYHSYNILVQFLAAASIKDMPLTVMVGELPCYITRQLFLYLGYLTITESILISLTKMKRAWSCSTIQISDSQPFPTLTTFVNSLNLWPHAQENACSSKPWDYVQMDNQACLYLQKNHISFTHTHTHTHTHILLIHYSEHSNAEKWKFNWKAPNSE
jgi:hypothetical protein